MFSTPFLFDEHGEVIALEHVRLDRGFTENWLQSRLFENPKSLPLGEIDPGYQRVTSLCTEMSTSVGPIDIVYVTPEGRLVIVETKLWRNPEARRKVVGQILDYAKELIAWSYADLQREVSRRTGLKGNSPYALVKADFPETDEAVFVDGVSASLTKGDFMLIIAGDGIHHGAKGIVEFLQNTAHMRFVLSMIEVGVYRFPGLERYFIQPRVLAKTQTLERVVANEQLDLAETHSRPAADSPSSREQWQLEYLAFWEKFLNAINLDDPEQPIPKPVAVGNISFALPPSGGTAWITVFFSKSTKETGCFLRLTNSEQGNELYEELQGMREEIDQELPFDAVWDHDRKVKRIMRVSGNWPPFDRPEITKYLETTLNSLVNAFRPRLKQLSGN